MKHTTRIILLSIPLAVVALTTMQATLAMDPRLGANNFQQELTDCFVYYKMVERSALNSNMTELAQQYSDSASYSLQMAHTVGNTIGMTDEAMTARINLSMKEQRKLINDDFVNFSVLLDKYADQCKATLEEPEARFQYWNDKTIREATHKE